jgi:bifunctional ADP-heptose synthase (sugar kinase/adenylyltransferase)
MPNPQPRVAVIGDAMVDVYHIGTAERLSPEAPIPVVKIDRELRQAGGARNVTENLGALGAEVYCIHSEDIPIKNRLMVGDLQLARWDMETRCKPIPAKKLNTWLHDVKPDAIIVADYAKGSINDTVVNCIAAYPVPIFIDCKDPWNYITLAESATFFPNAVEYAQNQRFYDDLARWVVLKEGAKGLRHLHGIGHVPAMARYVRSVNGAGDTVIAAYTYAVLTEQPDPLRFAAAAAAIAVETSYTVTPSLAQIKERL